MANSLDAGAPIALETRVSASIGFEASTRATAAVVASFRSSLFMLRPHTKLFISALEI
jgi:hypothetical protein